MAEMAFSHDYMDRYLLLHTRIHQIPLDYAGGRATQEQLPSYLLSDKKFRPWNYFKRVKTGDNSQPPFPFKEPIWRNSRQQH